MRLRIFLLAASTLAWPVWAQAQPVEGLYIGLGGGYNMLDPQNIKRGGSLVASGGAVALGSLGYGFGDGNRVEIEGDWRRNDITTIRSTLGTAQPARGDQRKLAVMVNLVHDFSLDTVTGEDFFIHPALGVGVGYARANFNNVSSQVNAGGGTVVTENFDGRSAGALAYQAIAGISAPIGVVPGLSVTAEYRFFALAGSQRYGILASANTGGSQSATAKFVDNINNSAVLGLRYAFAAPRPTPFGAVAPIAAQAPAPTRSYLVFFDWDRAELTDRARQIIAEAAQASGRVALTRIEVNGYTDSTGTPAYNRSLSLRRAQVVKAELVHDGVAESVIEIAGFGSADQLVKTEAGVREPQNRRVVIVLH